MIGPQKAKISDVELYRSEQTLLQCLRIEVVLEDGSKFYEVIPQIPQAQWKMDAWLRATHNGRRKRVIVRLLPTAGGEVRIASVLGVPTLRTRVKRWLKDKLDEQFVKVAKKRREAREGWHPSKGPRDRWE